MKARRKSDSKIIEVRELRGASDVIYSSPDMNHFYPASDLDFNLDAEEAVIQGWVARDWNCHLNLFTHKPIRNPEIRWWEGENVGMSLPSYILSDLTWESEPLEVEIVIKRKKK